MYVPIFGNHVMNSKEEFRVSFLLYLCRHNCIKFSTRKINFKIHTTTESTKFFKILWIHFRFVKEKFMHYIRMLYNAIFKHLQSILDRLCNYEGCLLYFRIWQSQFCNLPTDSSFVKLDIFEVIRSQNVLTYKGYLYCLQ